MTVTIEDVRAAADAIAGAVVTTPFLASRTLSEITGAEVWIKFENLQFTGSFKDRGALYKLLGLTDEEKRRGVIAMSAGNHAQGVAYHAQRLGIPATIVMPESTPFVKVSHTERFGARVVLHGEGLAEAGAHADELAAREGLSFVHPYDDDRIIAGQGTIALEMLAACPDLEVLVAPVGGGGLIGGNAVAAKALKPDIEIVGVEAALYPGLSNALAGRPAPVGGQTIAEGIAVKHVGGRNLDLARELVDAALVVGEADLERAVNLYLGIEKTLAEGAGAASLAALLAHPERFAGRRTGLILSGGNIDPRLLASVIMRGLVREGRLVSLRIEISDSPGNLAQVAKLIGDSGANIVEVYHQRLFSDVPVKRADIDVVVETRDAGHVAKLIGALTEAGFPVRQLGTIASAG
jgi:threonine dehydratase